MKVVILSYNHPELTERTVSSVRLLLPDSKILLIHNGSEHQHQTSLQEKFPNLQHLVLHPNRGFPGGANAGLREAFKEEEWVLFLTNDCRLLSFEVPAGSPALIAPLIWGRKEGRVDSLGGSFQIERAHLSHCKSNEAFQSAPQKYIPGTAFWIHRDVFIRADGFDESLEMFWEDVDFSLRAQALGFALQTDDRTRVLHSIGKTTHKHTHYTTYLFQRNRKRISLKYAKNPWPVYASLAFSWLRMAWNQARRGHWDRLKLLAKAILD